MIAGLLFATILRATFDQQYYDQIEQTLLISLGSGAWLWVALLVWGVISIFWSISGLLATYNAILLFLEIMLAIVIAATVRFERNLPILCSIFLFMAVPHALIAITQGLFGDTIGLSEIGENVFNPDNPFGLGPQAFRPYALATHPNVLGAYLGVALMLGTVLVYSVRHDRRWSAAAYIAMIIVFFGLLATITRMVMALVVVFMLPAALWAFRPKGRARQLTIISLVVVLVIVGVLAVTTPTAGQLLERYYELITNPQAVTDRVLEGFPNTLAIFQQNPIHGTGLYNLYSAIAPLPPDRHGAHVPAHNVYMVILAELGVIGGVLYAAGLWSPLRWLFSKDRERFLVSAVILTFSVMILFEYYFWLSYSMRPFTFWILGLAWGLHARSIAGEQAPTENTVQAGHENGVEA
jgi:hypothetical protein